MKKGNIVVNNDGWIGKVLGFTDESVKMRYRKCGKARTECWLKDHVRMADEKEIEDYTDEETEVKNGRRKNKK